MKKSGLFIVLIISFFCTKSQDSLKVHFQGDFLTGTYKVYLFEKVFEFSTIKYHHYKYAFWVVLPSPIEEKSKFKVEIEYRRNRFSKAQKRTYYADYYNDKSKYFMIYHEFFYINDYFDVYWIDEPHDYNLMKGRFNYYDTDTIDKWFRPNRVYDDTRWRKCPDCIKRRQAPYYKNSGMFH